MLHESSHYRIRVHVLQFLFPLLVTVHVEIVEPWLPELRQLRDELRKSQGKLPLGRRPLLPPHLPGDALLEHLQHRRGSPLLWLADQQMHMIRHDHVAHQKESILSPNPAQFLDKQVFCSRYPEQRQPPVATERQKMKMTLPVVALQSLWHSTPKSPLSKTEGGAPPSHHSPINYRSGILPSHAALKRKERTAPPGHPSRHNFESL